MVELQWAINEKTGERILCYRQKYLKSISLSPGGSFCPEGATTPWIRVPEKILDQAAIDGLVSPEGFVGGASNES